MVKLIDSDALEILTKSMGLTGAGAQQTELLDGIVEQNLDVVPIVRRGRTQAGKDGVYSATMRTNHTGAVTVTNTVEPYAVGTVAVVAPYPNPVPPLFDIWLLQASVRQVSGTGTVSATLSVRYPGQQGWGINETGLTQILVAQPHRLAHWDTVVSVGTNFAVLAGSAQPTANIGLRLARGGATELIFVVVSSATSAWDCQLTLGVFPVALGQDGIV